MSRAKTEKNSDLLLVAEQPGLSMGLVGIFIALFVGFVVRGALSPEKIKLRMNEAISRLGPDVQVSLDRAYISLSRGILPDFSVVVKAVHLGSEKKCWMSPSADINEIRFPISIIDALQGKAFLHRVEIDSVVLLLRDAPQSCRQQAQAENSPPQIRQVAATLDKRLATAMETPDFRQLSMARLKVNYLPLPFTSFDFSEFVVDLKSESPRIFSLQSLLNLDGETLSGDYSSHARLQIDFDEGAHPQLQSALRGSWREGQYEVKFNHDIQNHDMGVSGEIKHIPLSQVFPLFKKYKLMTSDFSSRQTWISSKFAARGKSTDLENTPLSIDDFKLEGDVGEVDLSHAQILKWQPVHFEPLNFQLKDVDIAQLFSFLNRAHPNPTVANMGTFNGSVQMDDHQQTMIQGVHQGLELIFSNKGSRQIQQVQSMNARLDLKEGHWQGQIDHVQLTDGIFDGEIHLNCDKDWKNVVLKTNISNLSLSDKVQKLISQGGQLPGLAGNLELHISSGEMKKLSGHLQSKQMEIEGISFKDPQFQFSNAKENFLVDFTSSEMDLMESSKIPNLIFKIRPELENSKTTLILKKVSARISTQALHNFSWSPFTASSDSLRLVSSGGWDESNNLFGQISIFEKGKSQKWQLKGTRDQPQFIKE